MNILILGGTGYLGTRIIESLYRDNNIFCVYRKNTKSKKKFENNEKVEYIVSDYMILKKLFEKKSFDCIINASCTYLKNSRLDDVVESNLIFPTRILSLAVEKFYRGGVG